MTPTQEEIKQALDGLSKIRTLIGNLAIDVSMGVENISIDWHQVMDREDNELAEGMIAIEQALQSALEQHWQPIETAPKDGGEILACNDLGVSIVY